MKNKRKIYVVGVADDYANWMQGEIVHNLEDADLVLFTGGADVDPRMYKESRHPFTGSNIHRDLDEAQEFKKAEKLGKHIIGICRGSQFTCVMSGGKLVQHQNNPDFIHPIETFDGKKIKITSTHHQAQYPWNLPRGNYKILAYTKGISKYHEDGERMELPMAQEKEVEITYYPLTRVLAIQGHPEFMYPAKFPHEKETISYLRNLLDKHMEDAIM